MNILFFLTPKSEVAFIESTFTLRQILEKMEIHRYSAIPILSDNGEYVGTITEGDILWFCKKNGLNHLSKSEDIRLSDIPKIRICFRINQLKYGRSDRPCDGTELRSCSRRPQQIHRYRNPKRYHRLLL